MGLFKCKMCGGNIEFEQGATVGICDSCGTRQTLPRLDDDRRANLYDRANHFRRNNDFDKAASIYEQILNEDNTDAEAYWSLVLCRYGIEYVEDPGTHRRVPTVNRAQFQSIYDDDNYKSALQHADGYQRVLYEEEATVINEIQKGILSISQKEDPFDVFICYKETDSNGRRTQDSVLANELYHQLTQEGFKVFFSRITLEDKLGTAYEPYIFAALNSAKVMVVLGTKPEYFNAVWVKNEWSRYLALVNQSGGRKVLIPAYRDMDPYDLPDEFSHLQAQDMSKLGFMQDLIRGIKKIAHAEEPLAKVKETVISGSVVNTAPLLKRAFMFLEDGDWSRADDFCEQVLNQDPENAQAYLGKLMAELQVHRQDDLADCAQPFDQSNYFQKAIRFGNENLSATLKGYVDYIKERNENARLARIFDSAVNAMNVADTESAFKAAMATFKTIPGFKDADSLAEQCLEKAEVCRKVAAKKRKRMSAIAVSIIFVCIAFAILLKTVIIPTQKYNAAVKLYNTGKYEAAKTAFAALNGYKDSNSQIEKCETAIKDEKYAAAVELYNSGKYEAAYNAFSALNGYKDSIAQMKKCEPGIKDEKYAAAEELFNAGNYAAAYYAFSSLKYKDSDVKATECLFPKQKAELTNVTVGATIKFGIYEQDNNSSNGKEEIEWKVLAVEGNKALVISQYALDCQQYNSTGGATTWERCSLRTWLNGTFYNAAFGADLQELIISSTVSADKNPDPLCYISSGNSTTDKVFLLSIPEVTKYFGLDDTRQCQGTVYCHEQGAYKASNGNCLWWLRSPGYHENEAASVNKDGSVDCWGHPTVSDHVSVRPVLWIKIGS